MEYNTIHLRINIILGYFDIDGIIAMEYQWTIGELLAMKHGWKMSGTSMLFP